MSAEASLLAEVPLFTFMDDAERADLATLLDAVHYPADHLIFHYGEPGDYMVIVRTGTVELSFKNDTGEKLVLEMVGPGGFFGELAFLDGGARSATARTTTPAEVLRIHRGHLETFLHTHPTTTMDLLTALGKRLRRTSERLRHTATRNVNAETEDRRTLVGKTADAIAQFSGSITFLNLHVVWFTLWIAWNTLAPEARRFDPYPFGLLTMSVSLEGIFLSVFLLLSQNRQTAKDRVRADIEYDVNLRSELEVAHLHEKLDDLRRDVLGRLDARGPR